GNYYKSHLPVVGKMKDETIKDEFAENFLQSFHRAAMGHLLVNMLGEGISAMMSSDSSDYGVGFRVVRGPDWKWENQDGGEGFLGTITEIGGPGLTQPPIKGVNVIWDNGCKNLYRAGLEEKFDLRVYDIASDGTQHESVKCDGCSAETIRGIRWKCSECQNSNLCSQCYSNDKHDVNHQFLRYDSPEPKKIFKVPKRSESQKVQAMGIFPGASVSRGRDWKWGGQDGGEGSVGRVLSLEDTGNSSYRSSASVQWPSGSKNVYRLGHRGNVDLKCTKATPGGFYYRNHMPIFG
ncbi:unnamed protein product, partial [Lymnaea stagnalis]